MRLLFIQLLLLASSANAATITAATSSRADVGDAVDLASDGDIVQIPTGRSDWTTTLTISKAITLQGAGTNDTVITSGVSDGTALMIWNLVLNLPSRMTGIQTTNGSVAHTFGQEITVNGLNTDARSFRIDNCFFFRLTRGVFNINTAFGVADHLTVIAPASGVTAFLGYVKGSSWDGTLGANLFGDGSYAAADLFGTANFFFFEDCVFTNEYSQHLTMLDSQAGGRYVFRHNIVGKGSLESHGLEAQRERSGRAFEVGPFNDFVGIDTQDIVTYMRGGNHLILSNTVTGYGATPALKLLANRAQESGCCQPFGGADGRNPWDVNHASNPHVTGTCSSAGALTMTDSSKAWTNDFWKGFTLRKTGGTSVKTISAMTRSGSTVTVDTSSAHGFITGDEVSVFGADQQPYNNLYTITVSDTDTFTFVLGYAPATPATGTMLCCLGGYFSEITANTGTQLTFRDSAFSGTFTMVFSASDTYEINRVTHYIDMTGRVQGTALTGDTPSIPGGWNDQTTSACYEWGNEKSGGGDIDFAVTGFVITENTHYFNDTPKPGYAPYTYPHPLTVEAISFNPQRYGIKGGSRRSFR